jgi:hypothetical protein
LSWNLRKIKLLCCLTIKPWFQCDFVDSTIS